jgi:preprotein translocase subunit SecG
MSILTVVLTVVLMLDCVLLIGVILIQRGKGGGLSGAFGGLGGAEAAFGTRAATTVKKVTLVAGIAFVVLVAVLGYMDRIKRESGGYGPPADTSAPGPGDTVDE